jgi:hypothetical protein
MNRPSSSRGVKAAVPTAATAVAFTTCGGRVMTGASHAIVRATNDAKQLRVTRLVAVIC